MSVKDSWVRVPLPALQSWVDTKKNSDSETNIVGVDCNGGYSSLVRNRNSTSVRFQKVSTNYNTASLSLSSDKFERLLRYQSNYVKRMFNEVEETNPANAQIISDYIVAEEAEINIQLSTKSDKIKKLCLLSRFSAIKNAILR
jgi:hypothetical protein